MFKTLNAIRNLLERDSEIIISDEKVTYEKFYPKDSSGEYIQTFISAKAEIDGDTKYMHIIQTYTSTGNETRRMYFKDNRDETFDFGVNIADGYEIFDIMDEYDITIDDLAEDIFAKNDKPLPNCSIKGIHIRYKINENDIPDVMEYNTVETNSGDTETRFVMSLNEQYTWMSALLDVCESYLREYEYITLYN